MDSGSSTAVASSSASLNSAAVVENGHIAIPDIDKKPSDTKAEREDNHADPDSDKVPDSEKDAKKETDADADNEKRKKRPKPRLIKEKVMGIWTMKQYESANFLVEWYKGLRASTPYLVRLTKLYWRLSKPFTIAMVVASLAKIVLPSAELYVQKAFLDCVQSSIEGKSVQSGRMLRLLILRLLSVALEQGLDLVT
jgi:hypothetical protein